LRLSPSSNRSPKAHSSAVISSRLTISPHAISKSRQRRRDSRNTTSLSGYLNASIDGGQGAFIQRRRSKTSGEKSVRSSSMAPLAAAQKRRRRSVLETPNPQRSHPRWERAQLAAAKKTKDRLYTFTHLSFHVSAKFHMQTSINELTLSKEIIVSESPLKPEFDLLPQSLHSSKSQLTAASYPTPLGSPLRRLWRANSTQPTSLPRCHSGISLAVSSAAVASSSSSSFSNLATSLEPSRRLYATATTPIKSRGLNSLSSVTDHQQLQGSTCMSIAMSRAERWRQRQLDEEASLSQFTTSNTCSLPADAPSQSSKPDDEASAGSFWPSRPGLRLRRQCSSNLFANLAGQTDCKYLATGPQASWPIGSLENLVKSPVKSR
ncbi:unnamed protein product, partial [Protopolystoma xenopodis]